jgi:hypothetical protein
LLQGGWTSCFHVFPFFSLTSRLLSIERWSTFQALFILFFFFFFFFFLVLAVTCQGASAGCEASMTGAERMLCSVRNCTAAGTVMSDRRVSTPLGGGGSAESGTALKISFRFVAAMAARSVCVRKGGKRLRESGRQEANSLALWSKGKMDAETSSH